MVLGHLLGSYVNSHTYVDLHQGMKWLISIVYSFHMPCFFICSGYLFCHYIFSNVSKILVNVGNFYIVYAVFAALFIAMSMLSGTANNHYDAHTFFRILYGEVGPYWYLYVLCLCYLLSYFCPYRVLCVVATVLSLALMCLFQPHYSILGKLFFHFPFFVLGFVIAYKNINIPSIVAAIVGVLSVLLLLYFIYFNISFRQIPIVAFVLPLCLALALWTLFKGFDIDFYPLKICGLYCYEIYLFHSFLATPIRLLFVKLGMPSLLSVLLNLLLGCLVPILISLILKKLNVYKYIFKPLSAVGFLQKNSNSVQK